MPSVASRPTITQWCLFAASVAIVVALMGIAWPTGPFAALHHVVQTAVPIVFFAASLRNALAQRSPLWWLITVFAAGAATAQIRWTAMGEISGPTSVGTTPDLIYTVALPFGVVGLIWLAFEGLQPRQRWRVLSDAWIVALALALTGWVMLFDRPVAEHRFAASELSNLLFPFFDILCGAVIITAAMYQPRRRRMWWMSGVAVLAAVSDAFAVLGRGLGRTDVSPMVVLAWMVAPLLLVGATLEPETSGGSFAIDNPRRHLLALFLGLGVTAALVAGIRDGELRGPALWLALSLGAAVFVNQFSVFRELSQTIADRTAALDALLTSEEQFRLAFEGAPVGTALIVESVIRDVNPALLEMVGLERDHLVGRTFREIVDLAALPFLEADEWKPLSQGLEGIQREFKWTRPDGAQIWLEMSLARTPGPDQERVVALIEDVTERRANIERLAHLAVHDPLTGLPNRTAFMTALEAALDRDTGAGVTVAFFDLDRFKVINDSVGHGTGDQVLQVVADRIRASVGDAGIAARFAGDEFTILFADLGRDEVIERVMAVRESLAMRVALDDGSYAYPTASVGVGWSPLGGNGEQLLARADAAMYRAKQRGRNRVEMYDEALKGSPSTELRLVGELHRALEDDEFRVHYQPIVEVASGHTLGYEALVRWEHPDRGLVPPGEFIPAAEESGLIVAIGERVLRVALAQQSLWANRWPDRRLTMSINVAARQVADQLPEMLDEVLTDTGVDPTAIWLELTESALMTDVRNAEQVLERVRGMGLHISVDDFGTGYSSLTYLQRFPVEGIKVDQSFVAGLGRRAQDEAICQAVISLGRALGLRTVAEGVETKLQLDRLAAMGADLAQGFLFSRPQPVEVIERGWVGSTPAPAPAQGPTPAPAR